jgi:8-oxo-dGTP pyrophosphatase MutT (NUDIX family)
MLETDSPTLWLTPGGGIELGETVEAAARREIWEETRIADVEVGPVLWTEDRAAKVNGEDVMFEMTYILVRAATMEVDLSGCQPDERSTIIETRWWRIDDLTDLSVRPLGLAALLSRHRP